jgi:hypothetical protein
VTLAPTPSTSPVGRPPAPAAPAARAGRYAIGLRTLLTLLAGRASYRLVLLGTTVALLPVWGEQVYGVFAAATASFSWLLALIVAGPEKAVLKLRPRARRIGAELSDALQAVLWWAPAPLAAGFGALLLVRGSGDPVTLYAGVATMQFSVGCTLLLVALHRAAGRVRADVWSFLGMSGCQLVLLATAAAGQLQPVGYVSAVTVTQLGINLVLAGTLGTRPSLRIRRRPVLVRRIGCTALLMGSGELFVYVPMAVLFLLLTTSPHAHEVAYLFAVLVSWSMAMNVALYVLRVYAPRTSLQLTGGAGRAGASRVARLARAVAAANLVWLAGAGVVLLSTDLTAVTSVTSTVLVWAALLVTRAPMLGALLWATFQLENTDATAPRVVALAAVAGTVASTVAGLATVYAWGGVGVIVALTCGEFVYAAVLARRADGAVRARAG